MSPPLDFFGQPDPQTYARIQRTRSNNRNAAQERIDKGLEWRKARSACVRIAQRVLEENYAELKRQKDPVEQAMTKLRQHRRIVFRASVHGGPSNRFFIDGMGSETIDERTLLNMARRIG